MWRSIKSSHSKQTEYFEAMMRRVVDNEAYRQQAEKLIDTVARTEPLFAESLLTPQSPSYHGEGPFLRDHLQSMLAALFAITQGDIHLLEAEELRRLKGFEEEILEVEETIREHAALFEVFILVHDIGKWASVFFTADSGSRGEQAGLTMKLSDRFSKEGLVEQAKIRRRYLETYKEFCRQHAQESPQVQQIFFAKTYGVKAHYSGHEHLIYAPVYRALLERLASTRRLSDRDLALLEDLIAHHMQPVRGYRKEVVPSRIEISLGVAKAGGYDADDFLDLQQAGLFLDLPCGSCAYCQGHYHRDLDTFIHFLQSEHAYAPWKREEKQRVREEQEKRANNVLFQQVGLDGVALMDLLGLPPGPAFGKILREIQASILGEELMPRFSREVKEELDRRMSRFYQLKLTKEF
ncbi:TPA: hypothetical protein DEP34_01310 [Candidatus Uhrbacteria bacterium]|uniref:Uncharacterized protein n=2 Tax=Candidatus Uhriibacteriota TaxID=1752732 RepID=A0A0G1Q684_9BACT|nr:MAG: hypothetical protein UX45_C0015G0015 [Candidatus Uhrbacteria bacterium GW2011_GWF2_46_218]KKU40524.1 MAG: hypothetical protein UX57_C0015G0011 [Candidatus Uhrbacteria bacterium GW2011_GWE2_46_68]HBK33615.1 hypothetical protein [Candidatus Uhrbacteria bacterium]HCB19008.1 hypothetical protein [Candidatus Uhrbacteria bacterium]